MSKDEYQGWKIVAFSAIVLASVCWCAVAVLNVVQKSYPVEGSTYALAYDEANATGVAIGPRLMITAGHVAAHGLDEKGNVKPDYKYKVSNGFMKEPVSGSPLWANTGVDIGVLKTDHDLPYYSELACRRPRLGEPVSIIGYPNINKIYWAKGPVYTKGVISSGLQGKAFEWDEWILVDAIASFGNSGGGVFDASRKIIGVLVGVFGFDLVEGIAPEQNTVWVPGGYSIMIPSSTLCTFLGRT